MKNIEYASLYTVILLVALFLFVFFRRSNLEETPAPKIIDSNVEVGFASILDQTEYEVLGYITPTGEFVNFCHLLDPEIYNPYMESEFLQWKQIGIKRSYLKTSE